MSGFIMSMLNLESSTEEQRGRILASYRAEKHKRRDAKDQIPRLVHNDVGLQRNGSRSSKDYMNCNISKRDGNRFNTIEEENTSDDF